jgi:hypothetical protein
MKCCINVAHDQERIGETAVCPYEEADTARHTCDL